MINAQVHLWAQDMVRGTGRHLLGTFAFPSCPPDLNWPLTLPRISPSALCCDVFPPRSSSSPSASPQCCDNPNQGHFQELTQNVMESGISSLLLYALCRNTNAFPSGMLAQEFPSPKPRTKQYLSRRNAQERQNQGQNLVFCCSSEFLCDAWLTRCVRARQQPSSTCLNS